MHRHVLTALLIGVLLAPAPSPASESWSTPHPGVKHLFKKAGGPLEIHGLVIDLCHPGVGVRATAPGEKKRTTSSFGKLVGAQTAINGDFFSYNGYNTTGYSMGDGQHWSGTSDSGWQSLVAFGLGHAYFSDDAEIFSPKWWTREVVSGFAQIMKDGTAIQSYSCSGHFCEKHPRTAVGFSKDRRTLYMLVVDGRTSISVGVTLKELANIMKDLGAYDAVNLDGGGSTTMWVQGEGVVNNPSDGSERVVANHLAAFASGSGQPAVCNEWPPEQVWVDAGLFDAAASTDVDGDGFGDFCARAAAGLLCALSGDAALGTVIEGPHPELSNDNGWNHPSHYGTIHMGDIDGDTLADVCARGNAGIRCWRSVGDGFDTTAVIGPEWSDAAGWEAEKYFATIRMLDVNGDGLADLCGRGPAGIECALANGEGFDDPIDGPELSDENGWGHPEYYGTIRSGDINGDGRHDLCARGAAGFLCWPSTGEGFGPEIGGPTWSNDAGFDQMRYWATIRLADINGDGLDDLCARGPAGIECYPSLGGGFAEVVPGPTLSDDSGWHDQTNYLPIRWGDINGDGLDDLCARANAGLRCWHSLGDAFGPQLEGPAMSDANQWFLPRQYNTIRLADIDGDGLEDLCARKIEGTRCWLSDGNGFPTPWDGPTWADGSGWGAIEYWSTVRVATPRDLSPCYYPDACTPGAAESVACGECGTAIRECTESCEWTDWSSCYSDGTPEPADACDDGNPCTEDYCDPTGACAHDHSDEECDDGDPCTESACQDGACVPTSTRPLCCLGHEDCDLPFERCDLEFNVCLPVLCAPCATHEECGAAGNLCLTLATGTACGVQCGQAVCPDGYDCTAFGNMPPQCMPADLSCECTPHAETLCANNRLFWFDGCGTKEEMADDCADRGCYVDHCCPPGTALDGDGCLPTGEFPYEDTMAQADALPGDVNDSGPAGGGCNAAPSPTTPALLLLPLLLLAALRRRTRGPAALVLLLVATACGSAGDGADGGVVFDDTGKVSTPDAAEDGLCVEGAGCLGTPCASGEDCPSGWCIDHRGASICTIPCDKECPDGFVCSTVAAGTPAAMQVCLSLHPTLCKPCSSSFDCMRADGLKGYCLDFGTAGDFCGAACTKQKPCPPGYVCEAASTVEGTESSQCLPQGGECGNTPVDPPPPPPPEGECDVVNEFGACPGKLTTTAEGQTLCVGPTPMAETCNNLDDDCDGQVDEGACSACGDPGACEPGATEEEVDECGPCSSKTRFRECDGDCKWSEWTAWSDCSIPGGSGDCLPGETDEESQPCGKCGTQNRTRACTDQCDWGDWGDWGACSGEGACSPGESQTSSEACGKCGTRTQKRTCNDSCQWGDWGAWSACTGEGVCSPGQTQDGNCDVCAQKTCQSNCQWGSCKLKPGAECLWEEGTNWECCAPGKWHFCLPSNCKWSGTCNPCTGCGC
jgi:hypothetical protein